MFDHILLPLDGSSLAECVLPHAVALANIFDARCTLLRVLQSANSGEQNQPVDPLEWRMNKAEAEAYLQEIAKRLRTAGLETERVILEGQAAQRIVEFAQSNKIDLIVLSSHGQTGLSRWNVSGVVHKIIQRAKLSIMIVRAYQAVPKDLTSLKYKKLLVPLDSSQRAECVLSPATTLARNHQARVLLAHVVSKPEMPRRAPPAEEEVQLAERFLESNREAAAKYLDQLRSRLSIDAETHLLVSDDVTTTLHELVDEEDIDLVILSAHGYSGKTQQPYGSVTTSFIEYGATPLLVVQDLAPEEVEPTEAEVAAKEKKGH
jgi:nucleotide-binding universal stress UspA family protein